MRTLRYGSRDFDARLAEFCQSAAPAREMRVAVASILADVRARGDAASDYIHARLHPR